MHRGNLLHCSHLEANNWEINSRVLSWQESEMALNRGSPGREQFYTPGLRIGTQSLNNRWTSDAGCRCGLHSRASDRHTLGFCQAAAFVSQMERCVLDGAHPSKRDHAVPFTEPLFHELLCTARSGRLQHAVESFDTSCSVLAFLLVSLQYPSCFFVNEHSVRHATARVEQ